MPKSHPPYPPELRRRLVEMVRAGRTPGELAEEFEPSEQCIRNWVKQADRDSGKRQDGLRSAEKEELGRLRRDVVASEPPNARVGCQENTRLVTGRAMPPHLHGLLDGRHQIVERWIVAHEPDLELRRVRN